MADMVIAVYRRKCYAGETTLELEKVLVDEELPEEYTSYEYEIKLMNLVEYKKPQWDADTIREFVTRLEEHYPHSQSVVNTIVKVAFEMMKEVKGV